MLYPAYEHRVVKFLPHERIPKHIGVMLDGNRRWAKAVGADTAEGYQAGADNIRAAARLVRGGRRRGRHAVAALDRQPQPPVRASCPACTTVIEGAVESLAAERRWRVHPVGALDLLPASTRGEAQGRRGRHPRRSTGSWSTSRSGTAAGARSRTPCARCCRSRPRPARTLEELADVIDVEHIAEHLYTKGQPDPDLVIRTSGEQRLGGFLLWQSAHSEFYFCEACWPDFRRVDFLRAIRAYAERERRFGA